MARSLSARQLAHIVAAAAFVMVAGGLLVATVLREPLAARSPASRTKITLALAISQAPPLGELNAAARKVATADPLQAAAFVMSGIDRMQRDPADYDAVRPLMQAAVRRQPTFEAALVWLAADHARRGENDAALDLFDQVLTASSDHRDSLLPVLTQLMQRDKSRTEVVRRLSTYPPWRSGLLARAIEVQALPEPVLEALLAKPAPPAYQAKLQEERQSYVKWLVAQDRLADAHGLYRRYTGVTPLAPVYDPTFRAAHPFSPFGWTLADRAEDYAERIPGSTGTGVMRLHASGKLQAVLLEQTLALSPGNWSIRLNGSDGGLAKPDGMILALRCVGQSGMIAHARLGTLTPEPQTIVLRASVPPACPFQRLTVESGPSAAGASEIEVLAFTVKPA